MMQHIQTTVLLEMEMFPQISSEHFSYIADITM